MIHLNDKMFKLLSLEKKLINQAEAGTLYGSYVMILDSNLYLTFKVSQLWAANISMKIIKMLSLF